jgi:hypothetical protein
MSPVEALRAARTAGIQISIDGDDLVLESAAEPPIAIVDLLTELKAGILAFLRCGQAAGSAEERAAIAEFEARADHIGAAPRLASIDTTGAASTDLTGSASTGMICSASGDITGSRSVGITSSADSTVLLRPAQSWASEDWLAFYDEKAGIAEYDHGLSRQEAEKRAVEHCMAEWLYQHPVTTDADDGCLICGFTDLPNNSLLAIGLAGGLVWLHRECSMPWRARRIAAAAAGLGAMGISTSGASP